ncbi:protein O-mannosyl-transferase TMTC2-like [Lycorma delicatula]|uniref:protein O-mannosyl-transferase TMTC2-like n=1 Tax=Lycorma delicatula TaxID=130591 RepID=UPI003F5146AA
MDSFICIIAALLYHNTLDAGFVYDDSRAILSNPDVIGKTSLGSVWEHDFWGTPLSSSGSHGSYRPLCVLSFRATHWACGFRPWGYHALNILLHSLATWLVLKVGRTLLPCRGATAAGLLFAIHPIHSEAVAGIVGRADLLSCIFFLLSFLTYLKHVRLRDLSKEVHQKLRQNIKKYTRKKFVQESNKKFSTHPCATWGLLGISLLLSALAMLSKETGLTVLALCAVYDISRHRTIPKLMSIRSLSLMSLGVALIILIGIRLQVMGLRPPSFASCDNPTARTSSWLSRLLTFLFLPAFNFKLLLWPKLLSFDWSMEAIPRIHKLSDSRNLLSLIFYYILYYFLKRCLPRFEYNKNSNFRQIQITKRSILCTQCDNNLYEFHSPSCRLVNNNNRPLSCDCLNERPDHITPPTFRHSLLMCLSFMVIPFIPATNIFFYVGFVVAERVLYIPSIGFCFLIGLGYSLLYRRTNPKILRLSFIVLLIILGVRTHRRNYDWKDEESLYRSGIQVNPPKSWGNLGSVLSSQGRMDEAEFAFKKALEYRPNMADVHYNLGILQQGKGQHEEAITSYQLAIQFRPSLALAHLNLGQLLSSKGRCEEAEAILRRCSQLDGTGLKDQQTHENTRISALIHLGRLLSDRGRYQEAVDVYKQAVETMPEYYQPQTVYNLLGETLGRLDRHEEAERWFKAALDASPDHVPAHLTYGKLLAKNRTRIIEAEQWFKRAQMLAPSDPAVYTHFGEFLGGLERHVEAARILLKGTELIKGNQKLPLLLAAATALRQAGRLSHAEAVYRKALDLSPTEASSHSNLGAILHLNGKYAEAAEAYKQALRLDPNDPTTLSNLRKLRSLMANPIT